MLIVLDKDIGDKQKWKHGYKMNWRSFKVVVLLYYILLEKQQKSSNHHLQIGTTIVMLVEEVKMLGLAGDSFVAC